MEITENVAKRVTVTQWQVVKVSRRTTAETVLLRWTSDKDEAVEVKMKAEGEMSATYWTIRVDTRERDHHLYDEVEVSQWRLNNVSDSLYSEVENVANLMDQFAARLRRDVEEAKAEAARDDCEAAARLANEAYRLTTGIPSNARIDTMYGYVTAIASARTWLNDRRAQLAALEAEHQQ